MPSPAFDAENHLLSAGGQTYLYDGDGKRVEKASGSPLTANKLYWYNQDGDVIYETNPAGYELFRYFRFQGVLVTREEANDWVDHYGVDALGNVRWVYGTNGQYDTSDYYPFGGERILQSHTANQLKFTGKERDPESGNDNFGARFYSPSLGRFMSPDEPLISQEKTAPQSWNLYTYAANNPINAVDPDGHDCAYLNDSGTAVEEIDHQGNGIGECQEHGGFWANGTIENASWIQILPEYDAVHIFSHYRDVVGETWAGPRYSNGDANANLIPTLEARNDAWFTAYAIAASIAPPVLGMSPAAEEGESEQFRGLPMGSRRWVLDMGPEGKEALPPTNAPASIGGRAYSGHALDGMQEAGLTPTVVEEVIARGTKSPGNSPGTIKSTTQGISVVTTQFGKVVMVFYTRQR